MLVIIDTYLGTNFSTNKKLEGLSVFATRHYLDCSKLPIGIVKKIFDSLFLPILVYGSDVRGIYDKNDYHSWEKDKTERTHIYFSKFFLGVNKQCPIVACINELGRLSLIKNIIILLLHLENVPEDKVAEQFLYLSNEMTEKKLSLMQ